LAGSGAAEVGFVRRTSGRSSRRNALFFLTTKARRPYHEVKFAAGDFLIFGRETKGLPQALLDAHPADLITIPMCGTRSINLATAVAVVLFDAVRQQS
jgi:tRNA (cytidine/uridine-2'-O-)-methyltransferase